MEKINVMVNGSGLLAKQIMTQVLEDERLNLVDYTLVGNDIKEKFSVIGDRKIKNIKLDKADEMMKIVMRSYDYYLFAIDCSEGEAVNDNVYHYVINGIHFVMTKKSIDLMDTKAMILSAISSVYAVLPPETGETVNQGVLEVVDFLNDRVKDNKEQRMFKRNEVPGRSIV